MLKKKNSLFLKWFLGTILLFLVLLILFIFIRDYLIQEPIEILSEDKLCEYDSDCTLSDNHPEGPYICVNKIWQEKWDANPESPQGALACVMTVYIGDDLNYRDYPEDLCECVNKKCERIDLTPYNWQWAC